ncbi:MAG TPA: hypothetical protein GX707_16950 [Epulopiscium sp.]|nr:hypothetical protein [Candidatus Epulonipiscium sp.]
MKAYIGIKYHEDFRNKQVVNELSAVLGKNGYESFCIVRDISKEESNKYSSYELMKLERLLAALKSQEGLSLNDSDNFNNK